MANQPLDLAIIGAGPIGMEAGIRAFNRNLDFTIIEKNTIGNHLLQWHGVEMFTPFKMNRTDISKALAEDAGINPPSPDTYLTGKQFVERWLRPLATETSLSNHVQTGTEVCSITREGLMKGERIGSELRSEQPFRLQLKSIKNPILHAETVIDASGTFGQPNPLGTGGTKAPGETIGHKQIERRFPTQDELDEWLGKSILLIGAGYSAATNLLRLSECVKSDPSTQLHWLVRSSKGDPVDRIDDDPLDARDKLGEQVNVISKKDSIHLIRGTEVHRLNETTDKIEVVLTDNSKLKVDQIVSNTGYRPDRGIYRELQFHECYGTEGPMDLAASLLNQDGTDCLEVEPGGVETLKNPESNFYVVGSKSYGRKSNFLLETGFQQISDLFGKCIR